MNGLYQLSYKNIEKFKCSKEVAIISSLRLILNKPEKEIKENLGNILYEEILSDYFIYKKRLDSGDYKDFFSSFKLPNLYEDSSSLSNKQKKILIKEISDNSQIGKDGLILSKLIERHSIISGLEKYIKNLGKIKNTFS